MRPVHHVVVVLFALSTAFLSGCATAGTPISRATHSNPSISRDQAPAILTAMPRLKGSEVTFNFSTEGVWWREDAVAITGPIVVAPTTTKLYEATPGGIVSHTYTTPAVISVPNPSNSRGPSLFFDSKDVTGIREYEGQFGYRGIFLEIKGRRRIYILPMGKCSADDARRVSAAFLAVCPNVN
jgi:hypothetical protein